MFQLKNEGIIMSLSEKLGPKPDKAPFARGRDDALKGKPSPCFPSPDSDWASRLYYRGFMSVK